MFEFLKDSSLIEEARRAKVRPRLFGQLLIFWLVSFVVESAATLIPSFYLTAEMIKGLPVLGDVSLEAYEAYLNEAMGPIMASDTFLLLSLFGTVFMLILVPVYCCCIEKRPLSSLGVRGTFLPEYGKGMLFGLLLMGGVFFVCYASGAVTVTAGKLNIGLILLYLFAFLIQGAAEEILMRGYFTVSLTNSISPAFAVFTGAAFFAALHSSNTGFGIFPFVNTFLFGLLLSFYMFKSGSIFGACALHGVFNFAEGLLFGLPVSGLTTGVSILSSVSNGEMTLTNGGLYGPEGGCAVTLMLLVAFLLFFYFPKKKENGKTENV